jgi:arylsulfatase A-like enzyme
MSIAMLVCLAGCGGSARDPDPESQEATNPTPKVTHTNVLMISVDTMRADHLGCYGYEKDTSPNIDAIAAEGTRFEWVYAPKSSTWPSLTTLQTSLYPVTHGVRNNGLRVDNKPDTLAEVLSDHGYTCEAILTNAGVQNWEGFANKQVIKGEPSDKIATANARNWLRENQDKKFFLWMHYMAPHSPWEPPEKQNRFVDPNYSGTITGNQDDMAAAMLSADGISDPDLAHLIGLYDGEVNLTDAMIGILTETLQDLGLYDNTLIVVTADHGEELYEHYRFLHHQASVYEGTLRVPLIYRLPGKVPGGKDIKELSGLIDIAPTILDILDIPIPDSYQGISAEPLLRDEPVRFGPAFGEWRDKMIFVRTEEYRYIHNPSNFHPPKVNNRRLEGIGDDEFAERNGMPIKEIELYRVSEDPYEQNEISAESPDAVAEMQKLIDEFMVKYSWKFDDATDERMRDEIDAETRQELENLGYVL